MTEHLRCDCLLKADKLRTSKDLQVAFLPKGPCQSNSQE